MVEWRAEIFNILNHPKLNHRCRITPGIREAECRQLLQDFFKKQRRKPGQDEFT